MFIFHLFSSSASVAGRLSLHGKAKYLLKVPKSHPPNLVTLVERNCLFSPVIPAKVFRFKLMYSAEKKKKKKGR